MTLKQKILMTLVMAAILCVLAVGLTELIVFLAPMKYAPQVIIPFMAILMSAAIVFSKK